MSSRVRFRALYLVYFAALGSVLPYQVLFLERNGLSATEIGFLASLAALAAVVPGLLWVSWSDAVHRRGPFIVFGFVAQMGLWLAFPLATRFGQFLLLMVSGAIAVPPLEALLNAMVLGSLEKGRMGSGYALVRIWGSIGWIISGAIVGVVIQAGGLKMAFVVGALLLVVCLTQPIADGMKPDGVLQQSDPRRHASLNWSYSFLVATVMRAVSLGMSYTFVSVYLDGIGTPLWLLGWAWAISALPEIPIMVFAGRLSDRIGRVPLLVVGFSCSGIMAFLFSAVRSPSLAVPLMALSGVSYGFWYIASVGYIADATPYGRQATAQGLFALLTTSLPRVAGPYLGGLMIDRLSLSSMFGVSGILSLLASAVLVPDWRKSAKRGRDAS